MKIIEVDNLNRDYIADILIAENVHHHYGRTIVEALNEKYSGPDSEQFFKLVKDDYRLSRGMEDLI